MACFYGSAPPSQGRAQRPQFWDMRADGVRNYNEIMQILHEKIFTGFTTPPALAKKFCDTNADVANLLVITGFF